MRKSGLLACAGAVWIAIAAANCGTPDDGGSGGAGAGATSAQGGSGNTAGGSGGAASGGGGAGGGTATGGAGGGACTDSCAAPNGGIAWGCQRRFMHGVNYAWSAFSGDFGGISAWGNPGVNAAAATHAQNLGDMRAHGASVIRWWMFPDFRGDGVVFDANESATGLGASTLADVAKALELADAADVYLMLTLYSFDAFRPSQNVAGIWVPGIAPMVRSASKRQALIDHVVRPIAQAVEASPYRARMIAWDVINEPEWAMNDSDPYGDPPFEPDATLDPVSYAQMATFVSETIAALRQDSSALVTVGGAAVKWLHAWVNADTDFHVFHIYDWVNTWWPYTTPAANYGLPRPIVMGEMPMDTLGGDSYGTVVESFWQNGYAGALGWMWNGAGAGELANMQAFAAAHPCETRYSQP